MSDFFISYAHQDVAWARWVAGELVAAGYTVVLQDKDFRPGTNFVLDMHQAAVEATRVIALLSPAYLTSRFTQPEWAAAFAQDPTGQKKAFIPIRVQPCELTGLLRAIVYIDLVGLDAKSATNELLTKVQLVNEEQSRAHATAPFPSNLGEQSVGVTASSGALGVSGSIAQTVALEEVVFVIDWMVEVLWHIGGGGRTFGEDRRLLAATERLHRRIATSFVSTPAKQKGELLDQLSSFVADELTRVISEADFVLPHIGDERVTQDWDPFRKQKTTMQLVWDALKRKAALDQELMQRLGALRRDASRSWRLLGFESAQAFHAYVSPDFVALQSDTSPLQRKLLAALIDQEVLDIPHLIQRGFPKGLVVETLNSLIRSELVRDTPDGFRLTDVGKGCLRDFLEP